MKCLERIIVIRFFREETPCSIWFNQTPRSSYDIAKVRPQRLMNSRMLKKVHKILNSVMLAKGKLAREREREAPPAPHVL